MSEAYVANFRQRLNHLLHLKHAQREKYAFGYIQEVVRGASIVELKEIGPALNELVLSPSDDEHLVSANLRLDCCKALIDYAEHRPALAALHLVANGCRAMLGDGTLKEVDEGLWADTQNLLGIALCEIGEAENDPTALDQALAAFDAALTVRTDKSAPLDWLLTVSHKAGLLVAQGKIGRSVEKTEEAIEIYRHIIAVTDPIAMEDHLLSVQNNLGSALGSKGELTNSESDFEQSKEVLLSVLEARSMTLDPTNWANTQINLGTTLAGFASASGDSDHIRDACRAFRSALSVTSEQQAPRVWAIASGNLCSALNEIGEIEGDLEALAEAQERGVALVDYYDRQSLTYDVARVKLTIADTHSILGQKTKDGHLLEQATDLYYEIMQEFEKNSDQRYLEIANKNMDINIRAHIELTFEEFNNDCVGGHGDTLKRQGPKHGLV